MSMTPKARKFRIEPGASFNRPGVVVPDGALPAVGETTMAAAANDTPGTDAAPTGRQLRLARRIAQKHGIEVSSDEEAIDALRKRGIDPFDRANMLQLVPGQQAVSDAPVPALQAPAAPPPGLPMDDDARASEIVKIQRDIARRRRRRLVLLATRLSFFVVLPTFLAGFYYYVLATPMFATKSEFVIQQADSGAGAAGGLGGLFSGTGFATQQDSISVQSYLLSPAAFLRLNDDLGFVDHFSSDEMDALQRLEADASQDESYALYERVVNIGYDPTEGVIKMEVIAADPVTATQFSQALIGYAEEQVDQLTSRLRSDQMAGATESFAEAERRMLEAQARIVDLQEQLGVVSAEAEVSNTMSQISAIETELRLERLRLEELLANPRPQATRVEVAQRRVAQLENEIDVLRESLTQGATEEVSLARVTAELQVAQADLATRQLLLQQAAQQLEIARIEANRQTRYLSTPVPPIPTDQPAYPRAFENTILAFLIFSGIYLMVSLTAAILREQVSG